MYESEEEVEHPVLRVGIRKELVEVWGEDTDLILKACQSHMLDAVATVLVLYQRFQCLECKHQVLLGDFFNWLNEIGYEYVERNYDHALFMSHVVRWATDWAEREMIHPCTDGMPSAEIH